MQETMETTQAMVKHLAAVNKILEKYDYSESKLIPILQEVQAVYKYLSKDMISYVATSIGVPPVAGLRRRDFLRPLFDAAQRQIHHQTVRRHPRAT